MIFKGAYMFRRSYAEELECAVNRELSEHDKHLSVEEQIENGLWEQLEKDLEVLYE